VSVADELRANRKGRQQRMSVSLRPELVAWVRSTAETAGVSMSDVVALALRKARDANEASKR